MNEIILSLITEPAHSNFVMLHIIIDNLRNGLEPQAKVYETPVIRFTLGPYNSILNTFQDFVFTYFKQEQKCECNYRVLNLFRDINKAENYHLMFSYTFLNDNNGDISVVKKNANIQR